MINNIDLSKYDQITRDVFARALAYAGSQEWSLDRFASEAGVGTTVLQRLYQGTYPAGHESVIAKLRPIAARAENDVIEFVPTPVTERMELTLQVCRAAGRMAAIVADTGRGKTLTCARWAPRNGAVYLQVPEGCTRARLATLLCYRVGIDIAGVSEPRREHLLFDALRSRHMLIVDEAGYLVRRDRRNEPIRLLQDLHDQCRTPIACIFRTPHWIEFTEGSGAREDAQLIDRMIYRCIVRSGEYYAQEIRVLLSKFAGPAGDSLVERARRVLRGGGSLRILVPDLMLARDWSREKTIPFGDAWDHAESYRLQGGDWSSLTRI